MMSASRSRRWGGVGSTLMGLSIFAFAESSFCQPANNNLTMSLKIEGLSGQVMLSNVGATREDREPVHDNQPGGPSIWFSYDPPIEGTLIIDTIGSDFDTLLAIYRLRDRPGDPITGGDLQEVGSDDDGGGDLTSEVSIGPSTSQRYRIAVDGFQGAEGNVVLNWRYADIPPNPAPVPPTTPVGQLVLGHAGGETAG